MPQPACFRWKKTRTILSQLGRKTDTRGLEIYHAVIVKLKIKPFTRKYENGGGEAIKNKT
jgi:hypothetical protein